MENAQYRFKDTWLTDINDKSVKELHGIMEEVPGGYDQRGETAPGIAFPFQPHPDPKLSIVTRHRLLA